MNDKIKAAIENLYKALKENSSDYTVSVSVFFNAYEQKIEINERTHLQLQSQGISMKNIKGEFIK